MGVHEDYLCQARPEVASCGKFEDVALDLEKKGFAVVRGCMDGVLLRKLVEKYEHDVLPCKHSSDVRRENNGEVGADGAARVVHISNIHEDPALAHLAADPVLLRLASACLGGRGVRPVINPEVFDKPPRGNMSTQTPPHQDNFCFQAHDPGIAVWIAADDVDSRSGAVRFVQGSHRRGLRFHEWDWGPYGGFAKSIFEYTDEDEEFERGVGHLRAGDIVVHHGLTIHHAPPNSTSTRRRGVVVNYIAEDVAFTLADDLYKPALVFYLVGTGRLVAGVPKGWTERQVLAETCIRCALAGWRDAALQFTTRTEGEAGKLTVEVPDVSTLQHAITALVASGHAVRGREAFGAIGQELGIADVQALPKTPSRSRLPDRHAGVFTLAGREPAPGAAHETSLEAFWFQTLSGVYIDIRMPRSSASCAVSDIDTTPASTFADCSSSAGLISLSGEKQDLARRHHWLQFEPFNGFDSGRISWQADDEFKLSRAISSSTGKQREEVWQRVEELVGAADAAACLELCDDEWGRLGFWVVIGSWFAQVVGQHQDNPMAGLACRSLAHAVDVYAEALALDGDGAVKDYSACVGRIEAPGVFRIVHAFDRSCEGLLLLDNERQLRRDHTSDILVEPWSNRRWSMREWPQPPLAAFGPLKRTHSSVEPSDV